MCLVYSIWIHNSKSGSHHVWCMIAIFNFHTNTRCLRNWTVCVSAEPLLFFNFTTISSASNRLKHFWEVTNQTTLIIKKIKIDEVCFFSLRLLNQVLEGISTPVNEDLFFEKTYIKKSKIQK